MKNKERGSNIRIETLGEEGRMGIVIKQGLERLGFTVTGVDVKNKPDGYDYVQASREHQGDVNILSLPADEIERLYPEYLEGLAEDGEVKIYININSVQGPAQEVLARSAKNAKGTTVIVNVHPYFGPRNYFEQHIPGNNAESLAGKKLIYCGAEVIQNGVVQETAASGNWFQIIKMLAQKLPEVGLHNDKDPMRVIDLSNEKLQVGEEELSGVKLHDYLSAYAQSPYHFLRLALDHYSDLKEEMSTQEGLPLDLDFVNTSKELTESIIRQNPYAEQLAREFGVFLREEGATVDAVKRFIAQRITPKLEEFRQQFFTDEDKMPLLTGNVDNLVNWTEK